MTSALPKTLLPLSNGRTILDVALANLRSVGLKEVVLVAGFAAERLSERAADLERRHGVRLELVFNDRAEDWNNAYSLWLAHAAFGDGVLLINGDTVHPASVEETLLAVRGADLVLALDDRKPLGEEEMKVVVAEEGRVQEISKGIDPATAAGEYIGVALIEPSAAEPLADALEVTWRRNTALYYEDGFREFAKRGGNVRVAPIGNVAWVEVDTHADLRRAQEMVCRY